jgi:solute carrier family 25 oxoglutarate transporter 11
LTFGCVSAAGDTALKLATWQYVYGGMYSPADYVDGNTLKHWYAAVLSTIPTCYLGVPFDNARRAYYADKTWPVELRRGYTSPLNALLRIPIEEGPHYLLKGGFPIAISHFMFFTTFFTVYSFLKNKFFFLWTYQNYSYDYIKSINMLIAFGCGSMAGYPGFFTREMVDIWPKERGGHCTWNNSYA